MSLNDENKLIDVNSSSYALIAQLERQKREKYESFKERIAPFKNVKTLNEAKELAKKIIPTSNEVNRFYIGDAKCTVVNNDKLFRLSIDYSTEFICYDFR